jgi:hypothetical protein
MSHICKCCSACRITLDNKANCDRHSVAGLQECDDFPGFATRQVGAQPHVVNDNLPLRAAELIRWAAVVAARTVIRPELHGRLLGRRPEEREAALGGRRSRLAGLASAHGDSGEEAAAN